MDVLDNLDKYIDGIEQGRDALKSECDSLELENDILRELVGHMYRCYVRGHDFGPYGADDRQYVEDKMRQLGMEV